MSILLIETSTERSIVGIVAGGKILFETQLPLGLNNSNYLAPAVAEGLKELNLIMADIDAVAVGVGPGSYTGIRVGTMLAKSLAFGAEIPLIGVSTLECFAPLTEGPFLVLIDAKISGVYNIAGTSQNGKISYVIPPQVTPLKQIGPHLEKHPLIVTPQANSLRMKLATLYPEMLWQELPPNLLQMASVAERKQKAGIFTLDGTLELLYLRKTQAELEKQEKQQIMKESP